MPPFFRPTKLRLNNASFVHCSSLSHTGLADGQRQTITKSRNCLINLCRNARKVTYCFTDYCNLWSGNPALTNDLVCLARQVWKMESARLGFPAATIFSCKCCRIKFSVCFLQIRLLISTKSETASKSSMFVIESILLWQNLTAAKESADGRE